MGKYAAGELKPPSTGTLFFYYTIQNTVLSLNDVNPQYRVNKYIRKFETFLQKVKSLVKLNCYAQKVDTDYSLSWNIFVYFHY